MTTTEQPPTTTPQARQLIWTRLGNALGYTSTETQRSEIRAAVEQMTWRDPAELADVLETAPARQVVASLYYGRAWALDHAALIALPDDAAGRPRQLIGLESVTGQRHVLLHLDYEVIDLLHETSAISAVAR
jgi:hypothetical protein